jgi:hypothetical protein
MKLEVDGNPLWAFNEEITIPIYDHYHNKNVLFKRSSENHPPFEPFIAKLSEDQIAGLWYIAEKTIFLGEDGYSGWQLEKKLMLPKGHLSSRVTTPLKKMGLINFKTRPTTNPESSHPNKSENAWFIERTSMSKAFEVLYSIFEIRDFNNIIWPERQPKEEIDHNNINNDLSKNLKPGDPIRFTIRGVSPLKFHSPLEEEFRKNSAAQEKRKDKIHPNMKLLILAVLQNKIEEYEYSTQYFIDIGVKPPLGVSSRADLENVKANLKKAFENE